MASVMPDSADPTTAALSDKETWRRQYRLKRKRRSTLIAIVSTVVFAAALILGVTHAPGWTDARQTFLSWDSFRHDTPDILRGLLVDLKVLVVAEPSILVIALLVATVRTSISPVLAPLRIAAALFVDLFRGCPLIILLVLFGVGIPSLRLHHVTNSAAFWGSLAIILSYSAFVTEVFRAGIQTVHPSQRAAARSLGLTQRQTLRLIVLPQAVRNVVPALLNDFVSLQRDVGLISIVGAVTDAIQQANIDNQETFNFTPYVIAAILFILIAAPTGRFADWYNVRSVRRQQAGAIV
jgi:polar amino acid transport system permease protein